jgi:hypothetical protein
MNYETLIQRRRFEPCQFAEMGSESNKHFQWRDVAWSMFGFAGALIPTMFVVLLAALIDYYGKDIVWLIRWVL